MVTGNLKGKVSETCQLFEDTVEEEIEVGGRSGFIVVDVEGADV